MQDKYKPKTGTKIAVLAMVKCLFKHYFCLAIGTKVLWHRYTMAGCSPAPKNNMHAETASNLENRSLPVATFSVATQGVTLPNLGTLALIQLTARLVC